MYLTSVDCDRCKGTGVLGAEVPTPCSACNGTGIIWRTTDE